MDFLQKGTPLARDLDSYTFYYYAFCKDFIKSVCPMIWCIESMAESVLRPCLDANIIHNVIANINAYLNVASSYEVLVIHSIWNQILLIPNEFNF